MSDDLDRQVAEAQGWKISTRKMWHTSMHFREEDTAVWIGHDNESVQTVEYYTPSTNLSQAVAFATSKMDWFQLEYYGSLREYSAVVGIWNDGKDYSDYTDARHPAEAICRATLKALENKELHALEDLEQWRKE